VATKEERRAALIRKFKEVATERVARISQQWLRLEQAPDDSDTAAELLRELHTLKGEAKTVGFADIAMVTHLLESLVFKARDQGFKVSRTTSDVVLKTTDSIGELLRRSIDGPQIDLEAVVRTLDGELGNARESEPGAAHADPDAPERRTPSRRPPRARRRPARARAARRT
jgi:two-component system chemotaxis sensor kinase CheA